MLLPNSVSHGEQDACYPEIPGPVKAEKEQSSPSLQNTQRNIYSTFASNAAKAHKKRETRGGRTENVGNRPNVKTKKGK